MKKVNPTNVVLGIIAAEVVLLTAQAFARDLPAAEVEGRGEERPRRQPPAPPFLLLQVLQRIFGELGRLIFGIEPGYSHRYGGDPERKKAPASQSSDRSRSLEDADDTIADGMVLKGDMQGIAEKLKDPAWAGVLAANEGNISLTDAERAVPMPNSAKLVQRLDRNPYVGKGMKNHSRD